MNIRLDDARRWGLLLETLSEMSDLERQLVVQERRPRSFIPDILVEQWNILFRGGRNLRSIGLSDIALAILLDFHLQLEQLTSRMPDNTEDKAGYIRNNEAWQAVREMADWTLSRLAVLLAPENVVFGPN
jgi:hypothetical protein